MQQKGIIKYLILLVILLLIIASGVLYLFFNKEKPNIPPAVTETKIVNPFPYQKPSIPKKRSYITFLVGDSMLGSLGKSANKLRLNLISLYPDNEFVNYNYGFGSTNILSVPERLNSETTFNSEKFPPILKEQFDLIIFDSFAYNPLSELPLEEGLKKQTEILDQSIKTIIREHSNSVVAIIVPIAPSEEYFAKGVFDLTPELRKKWVEERVAYIQNAISYAEKNNIPLINVYQKSLNTESQADLKFINPIDYIHPSEEGVNLISQTIAEFIFENQIFPK
jgi:hypothetical protein